MRTILSDVIEAVSEKKWALTQSENVRGKRLLLYNYKVVKEEMIGVADRSALESINAACVLLCRGKTRATRGPFAGG